MQNPLFYAGGVAMLFTDRYADNSLSAQEQLQISRFCRRNTPSEDTVTVDYSRDQESGSHQLGVIFPNARKRLLLVVSQEGEVVGHRLDRLPR